MIKRQNKDMNDLFIQKYRLNIITLIELNNIWGKILF